MQDIDLLRAEIDRIQTDLMSLFRQRLQVTQRIWQIKKDKNLPFSDPAREDKLIHQFDCLIEDPHERAAIQSFVKLVLIESRSYLEEKFK